MRISRAKSNSFFEFFSNIKQGGKMPPFCLKTYDFNNDQSNSLPQYGQYLLQKACLVGKSLPQWGQRQATSV
jgi:hypothetical protein